MVALELPTVPRERPKPSIERDAFLIIGPPKTRKTSFALAFPNCLLIDCERGARKYGGLVFDVVEEAEKAGVGPVEILRSLYFSLSRNCPYDAIAIDTIDSICRWYEPLATASMNAKHHRGRPDKSGNPRPLYTTPSDPEFGTGHAEHRTMVMAMLEAFLKLPCVKIVIAHSKTMISDEVGTQVKVADIPGKLGHWIPGICDHIGVVRVDPKQGALVEWSGYEVETQKGWTIQHAGSRLTELNGKTMPLTYTAIVEALKGGT